MTWISCKRGDRLSTYILCNSDDEKPKSPNVIFTSLWLLFGVYLFGSLTNTIVDVLKEYDLTDLDDGTIPHHRSKRFIYMTNDRRLNLPPGTGLDLESTASLPGFNPLPDGYGSETAISIPFDVNFDTLGFTSKENTFGEIPFLKEVLEFFEPLRNFTDNFRKNFEEKYNKDSKAKMSEGGGVRPLMFQVVEDTLYNLGIDGKACLLRTICEIHAEPLFGHGLFGEVLELFLSVSSSKNYLHILGEYLEAELKGRSSRDCYKYKKRCPLSIFGRFTKKQKKQELDIRKNFIEDESNYAHYHHDGDHFGERITKRHIYNMRSNKTALNSISREKRMIFFGPHRRIMFPLGSIFIFKPQIKLPWMGNLPKGYSSGLAVGIPIKAIMDDLGYTSVLNPFMRIPFFEDGRKKRDTWKPLPGVNYEGGDREFVYAMLENTLNTWGFDGKSCMLRAICEMHLAPLTNHGFFGEVLELFFTPSNSPHAKLRMREYYDAELLGKTAKYCKPFYKSCPYSIFISSKEKERRLAENLSTEDNEYEDEEDNLI